MYKKSAYTINVDEIESKYLTLLPTGVGQLFSLEAIENKYST